MSDNSATADSKSPVNSSGIEKRIDRLESIEAIRQLAAKYALSLDMRDIDAHVGLFAPDVRVGGGKIGRANLKAWVDSTLRDQFSGTSHHLGQHIIEFKDADHAIGVVYSKNEHETGREWVLMQMLYWDDYERIEGIWYFRRRLPCYWYASDLNAAPIGDMKMRWPGREPYTGTFHDLFPSWKSFWENRPSANELPEVASPAPLDQFLQTMRGDTPAPKIRVR
ncbi:nuclear transport factor 2 family protein [Aliiglaciecola lipolytica]|uniref:SnoaL-like domain-containing protein n=1 Tax=Aliiglaciecola lipolytica E3 TaxID=1127673 RepID=K6WZW8_9ALTE|nr:nuclear transport factor 2 family protein [Aliiglaciecola lipolytica]GAC13969.1 hypothetical protein GLIP_1328 [Aliiglaciecola lipolytica E3]